jgi:hypothetical protein
MFLAARFSLDNHFVFVSLPAWILWMVLGVVLIVLTLKRKVGGKLKLYFLLTGASATGFLVFVVLHNLVGALLNIEEAFFFVLATVICPLGFLVGTASAVIIAIKIRRSRYPDSNLKGGETN